MKFTKVLVVLLAVLTIVGCRKDIDGIPTETIVQPPIPYLEDTEFQGLIVDQEGNPVSDAIIDFTSFEEKSDENGYFKFNQLSFNQEGSLITIDKEGYFRGYKFVFPRESNETFIKVMLIEKGDAKVFNSSNGGEIVIEGASVSFKPNTIITESSGILYEGQVQAYVHWYDPNSVETAMGMPGDLRGKDTENKFVTLATFGMIAVELYGDNNEKLNLVPGTTATIRMQAPDYDQQPGVLPLWSFNEGNGFWIEEGEASLINGEYVGEVSHFSFWNCDAPFDLVRIDGLMQTTDLIPVSNALLVIKIVGSGVTRSGYTNNLGQFSGLVPKDQLLEFSVYDECGDFAYSGTLGQFSEDTSLPPTFLEINNEITTITGQVLCEGIPITAGYVKIQYGEECTFVDIEPDGSFESSKLLCSFQGANVSIYAINTDLGTTSEELSIDSLGLNFIDVGTIDACELNSDEWLSINIDGNNIGTVYEVGATWDQEGMKINGWGIDGGVNFWLFDVELGDNQPIAAAGENIWNFDMSCEGTLCNNMVVNFTNLDKFQDGYLQGTYSGELYSINGEAATVEGDFRIQLDNYVPVAKISGFAWEDVDMNGLYDNSEPKLNATGIYVTTNSYALIWETDGNFYGYVEAGVDFQLQYALSPNEGTTLLNIGSDETIDNDFDEQGLTETFQFSEGEIYEDFGLGIVYLEELDCSPSPQDGFIFGCDFAPVELTIDVLSGTAPYDYLWNTGETTATIQVGSGDYNVIVTDASGLSCIQEYQVFLEEVTELDYTIQHPGCGQENGSININNEFNFSSIYWFELGVESFSLSDLAPGEYNYEAFDQNGCSNSGSLILFDQDTRLGNQVFVDGPNGIQNQFDNDDTPLENVTVNLLDAETLNPVETVITNAVGEYVFAGEYQGDFIIEFVIPDGYQFVERINELEDEFNSDVLPLDTDPLIGRTDPFTVECGDVILYIDAGVRI